MCSILMKVWKFGLMLLFAGVVCADEGELWFGVSLRNGEKGPEELKIWEGRVQNLPEGWKGAPADLIGISLGGAHSWGSIAEYGVNFYEENRGWQGFDRKDRFEIAVPMYLTNGRMGAKEWKIALGNEIPNPEINKTEKDNEWKRYSEGGLPYLSYYEKLAENLVRCGYGNSILRLGWEFNGDWFPWGTHLKPFEFRGEQYDHARAYSELYRSIHETMMKVPGAKFRWSWNTSIGARGFADETGKPREYLSYFPGREYVDFISVDCFDDEVRFYPGKRDLLSEEVNIRLTWLSHLLRVEGVETSLALLFEKLGEDLEGNYAFAAKDFPLRHFKVLSAERFPDLETLRTFALAEGVAKTGRPGVQWFRNFAEEQKMGFLLSEWGVWGNNPHEEPRLHFSGGDNPEYIRLMYDWLQKNRIRGQVVGAIYFEEHSPMVKDAGGFNHSLLHDFPNSWRAYSALFKE